MIEVSRRPSFGRVVSRLERTADRARRPHAIAARLAVIGQLAATGVAVGAACRWPHLSTTILGIILITAISNALLPLVAMWVRPARLILAVLLLDVFLLTILLYLTGGPANPFASLYLIHVAMAVIVLRTGWHVVRRRHGCGLLRVHPRVAPRVLPLNDPRIRASGNWIALVLVSRTNRNVHRTSHSVTCDSARAWSWQRFERRAYARREATRAHSRRFPRQALTLRR